MINDYEATRPIVPENPRQSENTDVVSVLNGLIQTCRDGQEGFKTAAEGVERSDLKTAFYEFSQQRAEFAGVLQGLVRSLGGDPEKGGSFTAAVHRSWMDIKSLVTGKDEEAILNECERGEDHAKEVYADALKEDLPNNVREIVNQQSQAVLAAHNRVKALRDSAGDSTTSKAATPGGF